MTHVSIHSSKGASQRTHALMSLSKNGKWTPDGQTLLQTTLFGQNLWHLPLGTGLCLHNPITGLVQPQYTWLCPLSDLEKSKNISHYSWNPPDLGECLAHSISITIHGMKFMANNKVLLWTIKNKQRHMITKENHYVFSCLEFMSFFSHPSNTLLYCFYNITFLSVRQNYFGGLPKMIQRESSRKRNFLFFSQYLMYFEYHREVTLIHSYMRWNVYYSTWKM